MPGQETGPKTVCYTTGAIAELLQAPLHQVEYAIETRHVLPVARAGKVRIFDQSGVEAIRQAVEAIRARNRTTETKEARSSDTVS